MGHEPNYTTASRSGCSHIVKFLRDALAFRHTAVSVGNPHAHVAVRGICFARLSQCQAPGPRSQFSWARLPVPPFLCVPQAHRTPAAISSISIVPAFIAGQPKALPNVLQAPHQNASHYRGETRATISRRWEKTFIYCQSQADGHWVLWGGCPGNLLGKRSGKRPTQAMNIQAFSR